MANSDFIYRRTVAGWSALETGAPLAAPLRRILGLIEGETHSHVVRKLMRQHTETNVAEWLSQLQKLGLLEALPSQLVHDLDFTGSFVLRRGSAE
jgi:hypothetical protein